MTNKVKTLLTAMTTLFIVGFSSIAFAQDGGDAQLNAINASNGGVIALAAGLAIGLAALGGALAQGRTAASALEGIARNPASADRIFTPMILGLALIESLVIYALIIAFLLVGKIG